MRKLRLLLALLFAVSVGLVNAQTKSVSGTVVSAEDGQPIIGASVVAKGTTTGVTTNVNGHFSFSVPSSTTTLVVSYVGMGKQEVAAETNLMVKLQSEERGLDEIVVTALGIERQKKDLGYSTVTVKGDELSQAKSVTVATGLQGKVSGLNISSLNSGVFDDVKINLRGIRSLTGNNNPMLLLDGVPVSLSYINTINPNDVETVNVLKGTSAAAVYGPDARNGVIVVTTKTGSQDSKPSITFTNTTQVSQISMFPKFQTSFGSGGDGGYIPYENWSWGPEFDGSLVELGEELENGDVQKVTYSAIKNNRRNFFNTGLTMQNDLSYSAKNFYLSVQDANIKGVIPDDVNRRTGIRLNTSQKYKNFSVAFSSNYIQQNYNVFDNSAMGDYYSANNVGLNGGLMNLIFSTQADVPLTSYKDFENNEYAQYNNYYNRYGINPYIALDTWRQKGKIQDLVTSLDLKLDITKWLDINYRAAMTYSSSTLENTTKRLVANDYGSQRGIDNVPQYVKDYETISNRISSEFFANYHQQFGDFKVNVLAGTYLRDVTGRNVSVSASNLVIDNLFNVSARPGELSGYSNYSETRLFSVYGDVSINYGGYANIELTGRNDKTSVLNPANNSFFYPGVSGSFVVTDAFPVLKSDAFTYLKLRASWNKTGNADISPYLLNATFSQLTDDGDPSGFPFNGLPGYSADRTSYDQYLKPEFINSKEVGFEAGFLKNRINLDVTYYDQDNTNQIVSVRVPRSTGYTFAYVNAASFRNYGFETQIKVTPLVQLGDVNINFNANYSFNDSKVLSIYQDLTELAIGGYVMAANQVVVGSPAYVFNVTDYKRDDQGRVIVDAETGIPIVSDVSVNTGRTSPKHIIGLNPSIQWKGLNCSFVFEYKGGHQIFNMIGNEMAWTGVSEITGANHRERFVFPNSVYEDPNNPGTYIVNTDVTINNFQDFFTSDNYRGVATNFLTSGASWRLRELAITYDLPRKILAKQNIVQGVTVGFVGRNLLLWLPSSNVYGDPDYRGNNDFLTGGNITGITNATVTPPTRTFGGTISVKF